MTTRLIILLRVLFLITAIGCAPGFAGELPAPVAAGLRKAGVPPSSVGIEVREVGAKTTMLDWNSGVPFNPASTMKLVTTHAALALLGPAHTWKTRAYVTGIRDGDTLNGDLIIKGGGDPRLLMESFWMFLRQLQASGLRTVNGNLLLDRTLFEETDHDPASFDGDPTKPYNAGPDALLLNFQSFRFRFSPDEAAAKVRVTVDPPAAAYQVLRPTLTWEPCTDWQQKLRPSLGDSGAEFSGTYSVACGERSWYLHPPTMPHIRYFSSVFRQMWSDLGGALAGDVRNAPLPPDGKLIAEWESPALSEVIRDINKFSNNVMARQVLLTLGTLQGTAPANTTYGAHAVTSWIASKGIDAPELVIENGSGLSRKERISPHTMVRLLLAAYDSPFMPEFIASMPVAGVDGTMRRRM
ncbi:MAG: dacB, partial [Paucimonas sp.]|nr:dacB [Paucimonas sp.]